MCSVPNLIAFFLKRVTCESLLMVRKKVPVNNLQKTELVLFCILKSLKARDCLSISGFQVAEWWNTIGLAASIPPLLPPHSSCLAVVCCDTNILLIKDSKTEFFLSIFRQRWADLACYHGWGSWRRNLAELLHSLGLRQGSRGWRSTPMPVSNSPQVQISRGLSLLLEISSCFSVGWIFLHKGWKPCVRII